MLTGTVPYERETTLATMFAHVNDPPPALEPPLLNEYPEFTPVVQKAMAKKPGERYLSAGDLARDAAAALSGVRYSGAPSMVATGDARPSSQAPAGPSGEAAGLATAAAATGPSGAAGSPSAPNVDEGHTAEHPPGGGRGEPATSGASRGDGRLRRYWWAIAGLVVVVAAVVVAVVLLTSGSSTNGSGQLFQAVLRPVPDNHVTGSGTAAVTLHGDRATVTVDTTGLLNGASHPLHIHAFGEGICPPASAAKLYNGHLAISTTDGLKYYGPMAAALTLSGDTTMNSMLAFSRYPTTGNIHYQRTITITTAAANAIRNGTAVVVVHGIDYDHSGRYDNALDRSELNSAVSQDATAPALCGTLLNPASVGESG